MVTGVALTFDDCDQGDAWSQILDVLAAENVAATFFANGMRVVQFPEPARRTVAEGHALGAHGWDHSDLTRLATEDVERRLRADRCAWREVGADDVVLVRPPYGRFDTHTLGAARRAGYREMVLWDVDPLDWQLPEPDDIVTRVLKGCSSGSIVDLHVTAPTAAALPSLIEGLRHQGLDCVRLQGSSATLSASAELPYHACASAATSSSPRSRSLRSMSALRTTLAGVFPARGSAGRLSVTPVSEGEGRCVCHEHHRGG